MNTKAIFSTFGAAVLAFSSSAQVHAASLLLNGSFETPDGSPPPALVNNSNNIVLPANWTVSDSPVDASISKLSNLAEGTATGTSAGNGSPAPLLNPYDGSVALDGAGATAFVYQDFTMPTSSALNVQIAFGGRDGNSLTGDGSSWSIGTVASGVYTPIVTSNTYHPNPGTNSMIGDASRPDWIFINTNTTNVFAANTTYRFVIDLGNPDHVDAVSLTPVPEPTTLTAAALGAGLLGWIGLKRRRR